MAEDKEIQTVEIATEVENRFQLPSGELLKRDEYFVWLGKRLLEIHKAVC